MYNGFKTQVQYEEASEIIINVCEREDTYDRITIQLYRDSERNVLELHIDDYRIDIWDSSIEIGILKKGRDLVDNGIVNIAAKLLEMVLDGEFEDYFED